jgi:hypothetical protein
MTFDLEKNAPKKRKTQIIVKDMTVERKSTLSIRYKNDLLAVHQCVESLSMFKYCTL